MVWVVFATSWLWAQHRIIGEVRDERGTPLPGVSVQIHELRRGTYTDSMGRYEFCDLPPGKFHLHFSAMGYRAETRFSEDFVSVVLKATDVELAMIVIESAPFKTDRKNNPQTVETAGKEIFFRYGTGTIAGTLSRLPGVSATTVGVGVARPVIRGLGLNRIVVAENGVKQEGQQWGADHGLELDPFNVYTATLVRGPAALVWGSDAAGGAVLFESPPPPPENHAQASLTGRYESVNSLLALSAATALNVRGKWMRIRASGREWSDYRIPAQNFTYNRYTLPIFDQRLKNTAGRERHLFVGGGWENVKGFSRVAASLYSQTMGFFPGAFGIPRAYKLTPDGNARNISLPYSDVLHLKCIYNGSYIFGRQRWEWDAGWQRNLRRELSAPHAHGRFIPQSDEALRLELTTTTLNVRHFHHLGRESEGIVGISVQYQANRRGGYEFLLPDFDFWTWGIYVSEQWKPAGRWTLAGGLRYDGGHLDSRAYVIELTDENGKISGYDARAQTLERTYSAASGAAGATFRLNEYWTLKWNQSLYFRFPGPNELTANGVHHGVFRHEVGNADLPPEQGLQNDWSVEWENVRSHFRFTPFLNYFFNYIYLDPTGQFSPLPEAGQLYVYRRSPAMHWGGELLAETHPVKPLHLAATAAWVFTR
ncbi:MAG: TonB-dependent receptor, partial [Bacteroidia bacterium]|nr:TonB-dependent receptor [Bacteroidia bacterium]